MEFQTNLMYAERLLQYGAGMIQLLYHRFTTAVELYLSDCCGIVTFDVELYLRFAMELLVIFGASFQDLYHPFVRAVELY